MAEQNNLITESVLRERARLLNFIRKRIADPGEAEDILQDVFYEFVAAYQLPEPIEQAGAWLFRVARNRIIDRFRKKKELTFSQIENEDDDYWLDELLPPVDGPEAAFAREILLRELQDSLNELPEEQRDVFIAHELQGRRFEELSSETGVKVSTLIARKRYAVLHLRKRLYDIYEDFLEEN
ncbi:MAG: RNA polymerase sigma factor [Gammaproteobacteria bacterium]|nr:MAG: RNA polymerase sigma factor [Gammaproteobacteria bacterium]